MVLEATFSAPSEHKRVPHIASRTPKGEDFPHGSPIHLPPFPHPLTLYSQRSRTLPLRLSARQPTRVKPAPAVPSPDAHPGRASGEGTACRTLSTTKRKEALMAHITLILQASGARPQQQVTVDSAVL